MTRYIKVHCLNDLDIDFVGRRGNAFLADEELSEFVRLNQCRCLIR